MLKESNKKRYYTIMIMPHEAEGRVFSFKIPLSWLKASVGILACLFLLFLSSFVYSTHLSRKMVNYASTIESSKHQMRLISSFSDKTEQMNQALAKLSEDDRRLREMLGLKSWQSKVHFSSRLEQSPAKLQVKNAKQINSDLKQVKIQLAERKKSFEELKTWVREAQKRFAYTPSCWPVQGQIVSRFGYRLFPWRGFHSGIDISAHYGAPVKVTAGGRVSFAGWKTGYGRTIVVDHGHGLSTLYAHNAKFAVEEGQVVKKGQVVCYVGTSGYSTGPHAHYEVLRGGRPVNPIIYLNLNALSASRYMESD